MTDGHHAGDHERVACAILVVSDTRTSETDKSGPLIRDRLLAAGHVVRRLDIVGDDPTAVAAHLRGLCSDSSCGAVLVTGGTGIGVRDTSVEAACSLFERRIDGFGELFRMLSYEEIGAAAMLSRAVAGVCGRTAVFVMPGSPAAVRLAMEKLIIPQLRHIAALIAGSRGFGGGA